MSENKKAASGAGNTTDSEANQAMASVAQQGSKVKQRIMLLYPCDTCRCKDRCTSSSYSRCPACPGLLRWARETICNRLQTEKPAHV